MAATPATLFLKPVAGRRVRREDGVLLASDGETVEASSYWHRRLSDQDVEVATPSKSKPETKA